MSFPRASRDTDVACEPHGRLPGVPRERHPRSPPRRAANRVSAKAPAPTRTATRAAPATPATPCASRPRGTRHLACATPASAPMANPVRCAITSVRSPPAPVKPSRITPATSGAQRYAQRSSWSRAAPGVGREQAERREHRRRRADRRMRRRQHERVEQVGGRRGAQHRRPRDARAEQLPGQQAEHDAEAEVGEQVAHVEMQRERGDGAPELAAARRTRRPARRPRASRRRARVRRRARPRRGSRPRRRADPSHAPPCSGSGGRRAPARRILALRTARAAPAPAGWLCAGTSSAQARPSHATCDGMPTACSTKRAFLAGAAPERAEDLDLFAGQCRRVGGRRRAIRHPGRRSRRSVASCSSCGADCSTCAAPIVDRLARAVEIHQLEVRRGRGAARGRPDRARTGCA